MSRYKLKFLGLNGYVFADTDEDIKNFLKTCKEDKADGLLVKVFDGEVDELAVILSDNQFSQMYLCTEDWVDFLMKDNELKVGDKFQLHLVKDLKGEYSGVRVLRVGDRENGK